MAAFESVIRSSSPVYVWSNVKETPKPEEDNPEEAQIIWGQAEQFTVNQDVGAIDTGTNLGFGTVGSLYNWDQLCENEYTADAYSHCRNQNNPDNQKYSPDITQQQLIYFTEIERNSRIKRVTNPQDSNQYVDVSVIDWVVFAAGGNHLPIALIFRND